MTTANRYQKHIATVNPQIILLDNARLIDNFNVTLKASESPKNPVLQTSTSYRNLLYLVPFHLR